MQMVKGDNRSGFRIGGLPPVGVHPAFIHKLTRYFGTFPITGSEEVEMSIFTTFEDYDHDSPFYFSVFICALYRNDSKMFQCVFHKPSPRAKKSEIKSDLEGCVIEVGRESEDDEGSSHMIGGVHFFEHYHPKVRETSAALLGEGFIRLLQLSFPGPQDTGVKGLWQFGNDALHLYIKETKGRYEYAALLA